MLTLLELQNMDSYEFEKLISDVWEAKGYETEVRSPSNDRGVDIEAEKTGYKEVIQAKCYKSGNKVGSQKVREYATLYQQIPTANSVIIVTSSSFTKKGKRLGNDLNVKTVNGKEILEDIHEFGVKVGNDSNESGRKSVSRKERKSKELAKKSQGNVTTVRLRMHPTGNKDFNSLTGDGYSAAEMFSDGINHQPHYRLTNQSGLSDTLSGGGRCTMWITDKGIGYALTVQKSLREVAAKYMEVTKNDVATVEYRTGFLKNRIIVNTQNGNEFDFNVEKHDPIEDAVEYIISEFPNATLVNE